MRRPRRPLHRPIARTAAVAFAAALAAGAALAGCSAAGGGSADGSTTVTYWLWDSAQQPGYQKCADAFTAANPNIKVKISQYGWDDYWTALTAGLVSGEAPDVFTSHLSHYPELAAKGQLLPIDDLVESKQVDLATYRPGLADLWVGPDGKRYGLPKDYDTVAVFANKKMLDDAGITVAQLAAMTWNPGDGGSYEKTIAHLTVDKSGRRGDEPGFDKKNVRVYGLGMNASGGGFGQTEWSEYAFSNGWTHADRNPWGTKWNYGDPKFIETITWFRSLAEKGYLPTLQVAGSGQQPNTYGAGKYALVTEGSWNTKTYFGFKNITTVIAPVPAGPNGQRASMFNGLADNVAATTKHPEEAKKFVAFLGSKQCQDLTAAEGVAFPAVQASAPISQRAFAAAGIDTSAFQVPIDQKSTYLAPVADHWTDLQAIIGPVMDAIMSLKADPSALIKANDQVNALFK